MCSRIRHCLYSAPRLACRRLVAQKPSVKRLLIDCAKKCVVVVFPRSQSQSKSVVVRRMVYSQSRRSELHSIRLLSGMLFVTVRHQAAYNNIWQIRQFL